jgi:Fe-S-cluster-containing hydrogenase component 2
MIFVNYEDCNGCGACLPACNYDAILLQNDKATIDQECCEGCQDCFEACPTGAIVLREVEDHPVSILLPTETTAMETSRKVTPAPSRLRSTVLPVLGSILLRTGQELLPRLADLAMRSLDQRIASTNQDTQRMTQPIHEMQGRRVASTQGGRRRRLRQRRNRRMK